MLKRLKKYIDGLDDWESLQTSIIILALTYLILVSICVWCFR